MTNNNSPQLPPGFYGPNVYVGMRYVPLLDGDWDATKSYEPLTIVNYQGNSYTSRTFVAAGIPVTNTDYWALTGDYNAQLASITQTLNSHTQEITALQNSVLDFQKLPVAANSRMLTVGAAGAQFTTINAAINYAVANLDVTPSNRVTVAIYSGVYNEEITLSPNPGIDMIGIGNVTVAYASEYPHAPLFTIGAGEFYNIKFVAPANTVKSSYALHVEAQLSNTPGNIYFTNCSFTAYDQAGAGLGLGAGVATTFRNCEFASSTTVALRFHNYPATGTIPSCYMRLLYNRFYSAGNTAIVIGDASHLGGGVSPMGVTAYGNSSTQPGILCDFGDDQLRYFPDNYKNNSIFREATNGANSMPGLNVETAQISFTQFFTLASNASWAMHVPNLHLYNITATFKDLTGAPVTGINYGTDIDELDISYSGHAGETFRITVTGYIKI